MKVFSFRNLRVVILLGVLAAVAFYTKGQLLHSTNWVKPLEVVIYPINGDGRKDTDRYIRRLHHVDFRSIDGFTAAQAKRHGLRIPRPTRTRLGDIVDTPPPTAPQPGSSRLSLMGYSLKLRYWAWQNTPDDDSNFNRVRIFVLYYQGDDGKPLAHSLGLQKGLLGVVHAYARAAQNGQNNVVIAHELMHTVGATDKYDGNGQPVFPDGYAEPARQPRYPQRRAEIMAGKVPLGPHEAIMASSLKHCVVGPRTAREIGWLRSEDG